MKDEDKTKEQLIIELKQLRHRITEFEKSETEHERVEEALQGEKQAVQRLADEREVVAKIGRIIGSTLEIDKVYELFAEEVSKVIPFDRIAINTVDPERYTFTIGYITGGAL